MAKKTSTLQENGQITLPAEYRQRHGLKKGDIVVFKETGEGLMISTRETLALKLLDEIGASLKAKGITLEELMESGREIRQELYNEKYVQGVDE